MVRRPLVALALLGLVVAGCRGAKESLKKELEANLPPDTVAALENAEVFTLYSLDPVPNPDDPREKLQFWAVLGRVDVKDMAVRKRLVTALWEGMMQSEGPPASCFNPRHAIRVSYKGRTLEFVICFECLQIEITEGRHRQTVYTTKSPQPVFDKVLRDSGVALAPKSPH